MTRHRFNLNYRHRRGTTLVETLVITTLSAVLTGIVISGVAAIYQFNQTINAHSNLQQAMRRFSRSLREDIHRAERCTWQAGDQTLVMQLAQSQSLTYHKLKRRWVRTSAEEDAAASNTAFGLDESFVCECEQQEVEQGELIRLSFSNATRGEEAAQGQSVRPIQCEIVAKVGRNLKQTKD